jgi:hypothetical protein
MIGSVRNSRKVVRILAGSRYQLVDVPSETLKFIKENIFEQKFLAIEI